MPVIILGNRGTLPIDPTFDDGDIIQNVDTALDKAIGFSSGDPIQVSGSSVSVGIVGSSTFFDTLSVVSGSVVTNTGGSFATDIVQSVSGIPTPSIVASPVVPTPSTPDGGPTVSDFDDDGVVHIVSAAVETSSGGFITNDPIPDIPTVTSTGQVGNSTFTQGTITSGTAPVPENSAAVESGFGLISPITVHVVGTQVVS